MELVDDMNSIPTNFMSNKMFDDATSLLTWSPEKTDLTHQQRADGAPKADKINITVRSNELYAVGHVVVAG